jgi:hypothetical protein
MKLQLSTRIISIIGIIFLTLYFPPGTIGIREVYGMDPGSSIDTVDLAIESSVDLEPNSRIEFTRNFSITQKQDIYLIHIDVQSSENTVKNVVVNANINNINTSVEFQDSSSNYASSTSFYGGTRLSFRVNPNTTISILSNTLVLTIDIVSSSLFGELGTFQVKSAAFEVIKAPMLDSESVKTVLPMEKSSGSWYIASLSTLNQRKLVSNLFTNIVEDIYLRLDIEVTPFDYPLSSTNFKVSNGLSEFKSTSSGSNSMKSTIYANLTSGDNLVLEFNFRPSSDLTNTVIELQIKVEATPVTITPDIGPSGPDEESPDIDLNFLNLQLPDLELLRFSMIFVPLFLYFNRGKKENNKLNNDNIQKGDSLGTNEK